MGTTHQRRSLLSLMECNDKMYVYFRNVVVHHVLEMYFFHANFLKKNVLQSYAIQRIVRIAFHLPSCKKRENSVITFYTLSSFLLLDNSCRISGENSPELDISHSKFSRLHRKMGKKISDHHHYFRVASKYRNIEI